MQDSHCLEFDAFRLDLHDERLWRDQEVLHLHPKTFAVLCCLVTQAGQLVTKDALLAAVWPETVVSESVITVAIRQLRQALGDGARTPRFIETVHGRGYRFIAPVSPPASPGEDGRVEAPRQLRSPLVSRPRHFVGRDAELAQLRQWWTTVRQGQRQIGLIVGEPGMGKTALVEAFVADMVATEDVWVGHGQCIDHYGAGEAYLPVLEALGRLCRGPRGASLIPLLRQYAPSWLVHLPALLVPEDWERLTHTVRDVTPDRMLRELADALEVLTATRPLVLVLEDLHWSDSATLAWLAYLVRRRDAARLLILGTYRPIDVIVHAPPLYPLMTELRRHPQCAELVLDYLSVTAVTAYLRQRFEATPVPSGLPQRLQQRTSGNPLFLVTLVNYWVSQGWLAEGEDGWTLSTGLPESQASIPVSLWQMIEAQLDRLSPEEQQVLEVGSVAGVEFSAAAVAAGCADDVMRSDERCAALVRRSQLLRLCGEQVWPDGTVAGCYAFVHALYHEVLYSRLTVARRVALHRQIGVRMEAAYGTQTEDIAGELAQHFERGRDDQRAVQYLRQAANNALCRSAYREAIAHLTKGLDILQRLPGTLARAQQELDIQIVLGRAFEVTKGQGSPEVGQTFTRARELCRQVGDTSQLFDVLAGLYIFALSRRELQTARELGEESLALAQHQPDLALRIRAHGNLGIVLGSLGEPALAHTHLAQAIACYTRQRDYSLIFPYTPGNPVIAYLAHAAFVLWTLGYPAQALTRINEALTLAQELSHAYSVVRTLYYAAWLRQARREADAVRELAEAALALSTKQGFAREGGHGLFLRGWALAMQGQGEAGVVQMQQGLAIYQDTGTAVNTLVFAILAEVYGGMGQAEAGLRLLAAALAVMENTGERCDEAELYRIKGDLLLQQAVPNMAQAEACFQQALAVARRQQARSLELRAATSLSRLWQSQGKCAEAQQLLTPVYDWFTEGVDTADLWEARTLLEALA
jgi:DNA-binding winged helix-turn-helix (wHTH) protein/predicted ATPase